MVPSFGTAYQPAAPCALWMCSMVWSPPLLPRELLGRQDTCIYGVYIIMFIMFVLDLLEFENIQTGSPQQAYCRDPLLALYRKHGPEWF